MPMNMPKMCHSSICFRWPGTLPARYCECPNMWYSSALICSSSAGVGRLRYIPRSYSTLLYVSPSCMQLSNFTFCSMSGSPDGSGGLRWCFFNIDGETANKTHGSAKTSVVLAHASLAVCMALRCSLGGLRSPQSWPRSGAIVSSRQELVNGMSNLAAKSNELLVCAFRGDVAGPNLSTHE